MHRNKHPSRPLTHYKHKKELQIRPKVPPNSPLQRLLLPSPKYMYLWDFVVFVSSSLRPPQKHHRKMRCLGDNSLCFAPILCVLGQFFVFWANLKRNTQKSKAEVFWGCLFWGNFLMFFSNFGNPPPKGAKSAKWRCFGCIVGEIQKFCCILFSPLNLGPKITKLGPQFEKFGPNFGSTLS